MSSSTDIKKCDGIELERDNFSEDDKKKEDIIRCLCQGNIMTIEHEILANVKKYYHKGVKNLKIFEPPKPGTDILLLEHYVSDRHISENTNFCIETGFNRECVIYHVEEPIIRGGSYDNPNNIVVLSYSVLHGSRCERRIAFRDFFCGFYYPRELSDEEKVIVKQYREIVDERFSIRRI